MAYSLACYANFATDIQSRNKIQYFYYFLKKSIMLDKMVCKRTSISKMDELNYSGGVLLEALKHGTEYPREDLFM